MSEEMFLNPEVEKIFEKKALEFSKKFTSDVLQVNQAQERLNKLQDHKTDLEKDIEKYRQAVKDADIKNVESMGSGEWTDEQRKAYVLERKQSSEMVTEIKKMLPALDDQIKVTQDRLRLEQMNLSDRLRDTIDGPQTEIVLMVSQKIIEAVKIWETWKQVSRRVCRENGLPLMDRFIKPEFNFAMRKLPEMSDDTNFIIEQAQDICRRFSEGLHMCRMFLTCNNR